MRVAYSAWVVVVLACAGRTSAAKACPPVPEAEWVGGMAVYRECSVDRAARPIGTPPRTQYTPTPGGQDCFRAVIDVVVDVSGRPIKETARTVRSTDAGFLQALLATLEARRYEPAQRGGTAVPQIVRIDEGMAVRVVTVAAGSSPPSSGRRPTC